MEPGKNSLRKSSIEDLYVQSIEVGPAYTKQQLVGRDLNQIKQTGLCLQACIKWRSVDPAYQYLPHFKDHFTKAYQTRLQSGPMTGTAGFHGAANIEADKDDSLGIIMDSISWMQLANNTISKIKFVVDNKRPMRECNENIH